MLCYVCTYIYVCMYREIFYYFVWAHSFKAFIYEICAFIHSYIDLFLQFIILSLQHTIVCIHSIKSYMFSYVKVCNSSSSLPFTSLFTFHILSLVLSSTTVYPFHFAGFYIISFFIFNIGTTVQQR